MKKMQLQKQLSISKVNSKRTLITYHVFLNNGPFDETLKNAIRAVVSPETEVEFGLIPQKHWGYPEWVDKYRAAEARQKMDCMVFVWWFREFL